jgi:hypothetical protein
VFFLLTLGADSKTEDPETDMPNSRSGTSLPRIHTPRPPQVRMPSNGETAQNLPVAQPMQPIVPLTLDESPDNPHIARADTMHILQNQTRLQPTATQRLRDPLPWRYDIYASRWFGTLLSTIMVLVSGYFLVIVVLQALGPELAGLQAGGEILLSSVGLFRSAACFSRFLPLVPVGHHLQLDLGACSSHQEEMK